MIEDPWVLVMGCYAQPRHPGARLEARGSLRRGPHLMNKLYAYVFHTTCLHPSVFTRFIQLNLHCFFL